MKLANIDDRAGLLVGADRAIDIARASGGKFGPTLPALYENWDAFRAWADELDATGQPTFGFERGQLACPSPAPRQIVAVGLNYRQHAAEAGLPAPDALPPVFTKFATSLTGAEAEVALPPDGHVDWEVELVLVIGRCASRVESEDAWDHIAGLCVGQDISERITQMLGAVPQFSLGKSFPGFAPVGPWVVTPDNVADRDDLELGCAIDGVEMQRARTSELIFPVSELIARLSRTITLLPGDLVFTGTPAGVGLGRSPQRYLRPGEHLHSWIEGVGEIDQHFIAAPSRS